MTLACDLTGKTRLSKVFAAISMATVFGLHGGVARAAVPGDLGVLDVPSVTSVYNSGLSGDFTDIYSFKVASEATLGSKLLSISFEDMYGNLKYDIQGFATTLVEDGQEVAWGAFETVSAYGYDLLVSTLYYTPLSSRSKYELYVEGNSTGYRDGFYKGVIALASVSPVPEPEIYAMMAVGMGIMGWAARRNRRRQAVH